MRKTPDNISPIFHKKIVTNINKIGYILIILNIIYVLFVNILHLQDNEQYQQTKFWINGECARLPIIFFDSSVFHKKKTTETKIVTSINKTEQILIIWNIIYVLFVHISHLQDKEQYQAQTKSVCLLISIDKTYTLNQ